MKCTTCFMNGIKNHNSDGSAHYMKQNMNSRPAPFIQRRVLICEKCGVRINTVETLTNKPEVYIDKKEYLTLKHMMSIIEALGSSRQEAYNIAQDISDNFLSMCYQKGSGAKKYICKREDLIIYTYTSLKKLNKENLKWGIHPNCDMRYIAKYDIDYLLKRMLG